MASEDSNRKVSSVFITLATPHQTKPKQYGRDENGWVHIGPSQRSSGFQSSAPRELSHRPPCSESGASVQSGHDMGMLWENDNRDVAGSIAVPPPLPSPSPPLPSPPSPSALHSYPPDPLPTPPPPAQKPVSRPSTSPRLLHPNKEVVKRAASSGMNTNEKPSGIQKDNPSDSRDLCGFCQKPIPFSEPALAALKTIYHKSCFRCSNCSKLLAGKKFYQKEEAAECEACYEESLERCWSCGYLIRGQLIRALQRVYHPACFTCITCKQPLQNFILADTGEIYCYLDYGRKFAKKCSACHKLIMSSEGSFPTRIESDGRNFHEECYRCEVCHFKFSLSPEKKEHGCYSLCDKRLCLACYQKHQGTTG
ncbi:filamin-binding LIM protein 1 [Phyllopteryx taeniolatus]|uniref:filamin-binding LIM protein 1 n=1 Tax=Phyllopteryx taeniolatus TaxID=161469 RepID=UPI002AD34702|nr:filamin-binding LIM protein 1 [Phyllopteryx taeniolatus]